MNTTGAGSNPNGATLIFDGDCGFCTTTANYIKAKSTAPLDAHPWQFIEVAAFGLTEEQTASRVYFVRNGKAYGGHAAIAHVFLAQRNWLFKIAAGIMLTPPFSWVARVGYVLLAKYRHKMPGGTPACKL